MRKTFFLRNIVFFFLMFSPGLTAQQIVIVDSSTTSSLRGLSVVNDRVIWASGEKGMVGRSIDSGNTWKWKRVKQFENIDFRDIEAFNETQAVIMGIGDPAFILRTIDGGENWKVVFEHQRSNMFLDAMEFWNEQSGIVIGDPIDGKFFVARTFDGGNTWKRIPDGYRPDAEIGEACFAASGTNIRKYNKEAVCFVSGGTKSRIFIKQKQITLPIVQGGESLGANSLGIKNEKIFIVTGGDYKSPEDTTGVCAITEDGGRTWRTPIKNPGGYRSCVEFIKKDFWITCGMNGVDVSNDNGKTWDSISTDGFHVCRKAKDGKAVFLAGKNGRIAKLIQD